ncbi:UNVERIFIED_CONTAM: hypothetical protein K2H54_075149 [Gekko kuhli]
MWPKMRHGGCGRHQKRAIAGRADNSCGMMNQCGKQKGLPRLGQVIVLDIVLDILVLNPDSPGVGNINIDLETAWSTIIPDPGSPIHPDGS